jgi:hypothetical protein
MTQNIFAIGLMFAILMLVFYIGFILFVLFVFIRDYIHRNDPPKEG